MGCSGVPKIENNEKIKIIPDEEKKDEKNINSKKEKEINDIIISSQEEKEIDNISSSEDNKIKINLDNLINKIELFIDLKGDLLKKYNYFKIDFQKYNYIFITPEPLILLFSSFYIKILKNSLTLFPENYHQAEELLNDIENEEGIKKNWIMISPCIELEKILQIFTTNKNI